MNLYLASGNAHKLSEMGEILASSGVELNLYSAAAVGGMPEVDESAGSFEGNARLKAEALLARLIDDDWVVADDSGLVVDALNGAPGVHSARYAGEGASDRENLRKLLAEMAIVPEMQRTARFVCVLVLLNRRGEAHVFEGSCEGTILREPEGDSGFGYDPVFQPSGHRGSFGTLGPEVKHGLSHRARALEQFSQWLQQRD